MSTKQRLEELKAYAEDQVDIVNENLCNAFTQLCRDVVADWAKRYPRHRFRIWEAHGTISTEVSPPLGWNKRQEWEDITYYTGQEFQRGAVAKLWREAQDIHDAFVNLDLKVQFTVDSKSLDDISSPA